MHRLVIHLTACLPPNDKSGSQCFAPQHTCNIAEIRNNWYSDIFCSQPQNWNCFPQQLSIRFHENRLKMLCIMLPKNIAHNLWVGGISKCSAQCAIWLGLGLGIWFGSWLGSGLDQRFELVLGSGLGQKFVNCACAISKLHSIGAFGTKLALTVVFT